MRDLGGGNESLSVRTAAVKGLGSREPAACASFQENCVMFKQQETVNMWKCFQLKMSPCLQF